MASDKTVTIKGATDKQLDDLILRLRKENEALYLVQDIKRKSEPRDPLQPYAENTVSAEQPVESLYHFGVRGMRWGVRRTQRALDANRADEASLRKSGMDKEADAVASTGKKLQAKLDKKLGKGESEEHNRTMDLKLKGAENLTNAELKVLNERLQLEKTYKSLTKAELSEGQQIMKDMLTNAAKEKGKEFVAKALGVGLGVAGGAAAKGLTKAAGKVASQNGKMALEILGKLLSAAG